MNIWQLTTLILVVVVLVQNRALARRLIEKIVDKIRSR